MEASLKKITKLFVESVNCQEKANIARGCRNTDFKRVKADVMLVVPKRKAMMPVIARNYYQCVHLIKLANLIELLTLELRKNDCLSEYVKFKQPCVVMADVYGKVNRYLFVMFCICVTWIKACCMIQLPVNVPWS